MLAEVEVWKRRDRGGGGGPYGECEGSSTFGVDEEEGGNCGDDLDSAVTKGGV